VKIIEKLFFDDPLHGTPVFSGFTSLKNSPDDWQKSTGTSGFDSQRSPDFFKSVKLFPSGSRKNTVVITKGFKKGRWSIVETRREKKFGSPLSFPGMTVFEKKRNDPRRLVGSRVASSLRG